MPTRLALTSGAYSARSVIANAQRCVNLFPEANPNETSPPAPVTHYTTPGLILKATASRLAVTDAWRGLYYASSNELYGVFGTTLYRIGQTWTLTSVGTIATTAGTVSMSDNGSSLFLVDGSAAGYTVDLATHAFSTVSSPAYYGSNAVGYLDTFLVFNQPNTRNWYCSDSNAATFNALYIAGKYGGSDLLVTIAVAHKLVYLFGQRTTEIWYLTGDVAFPFGRQEGVFIEAGCSAIYSVGRIGPSLLWLSQDALGQAVVMMVTDYQTQVISTAAISAEMTGYSRIDDAIGWTYQLSGHTFYVLNFPTADKTWVYDLTTGQWHEWVWTDTDGAEHRCRAGYHAFAYGKHVVGDWETGKLYVLDQDTYTDNGDPIVRRRGFPHMGANGVYVTYDSLLLDMEVGGTEGFPVSTPPLISLRCSDTRGRTWNDPLVQSMGATGEFNSVIQFNRLGRARDRVFETFWSSPVKTALNGAFVRARAGRS